MEIPLIDLRAQYESISDEIDKVIKGVLQNGAFILGPNVAAFEREVADYLGVQYAIGVASGTDALLLSLRALGIGPGDEVVVPCFTFYATAGAVMLLGATPVLVDVDSENYNMDIEQLERHIGRRTKAIIPVHLFGHPADMDPIMEIAEQHGLSVIEDNAQAIGAEYKGRKTGSLGHVGCLSFYPTKNLGAYGDGGMIVTEDATLAEQLRMLRTHGWTRKYHPEIVGYNSRLDELQAAILRVKLGHLDDWNRERRRCAHAYDETLASKNLALPFEQEYAHHVYHLYVIQVSDRDRIAQELAEAGINSGVYYPRPLHLLPVMERQGYRRGDFPVSEAASEHCLAIPLFPEMTPEQLQHVVGSLCHITSA